MIKNLLQKKKNDDILILTMNRPDVMNFINDHGYFLSSSNVQVNHRVPRRAGNMNLPAARGGGIQTSTGLIALALRRNNEKEDMQ
jgi:hypothetical protein